MSVEYNRILRAEAQIEKHVLQCMEQNDGIFIPPDVVSGRRVFFVVDNVDFAEDTPDGKRTMHGTAMAIFQRKHPGDVTYSRTQVVYNIYYFLKPPLRALILVSLTRCIGIVYIKRPSIQDAGKVDRSEARLLECPDPPPKPKIPTYSAFSFNTGGELLMLKDFAWLLGRNMTRSPVEERDETSSVDGSQQKRTASDPRTCLVWI